MDAITAARLIEVNHQFYQTFAVQFSDTRQRIQPGVRSVIESEIGAQDQLLDLGCGNGELARVLAGLGHTGGYVGVDFSPGLLAEARQAVPPGYPAAFIQADLSSPGWENTVLKEAGPLPQTVFDRVLSFAVLHHIPGAERRREFLLSARRCLRPGGRLIFSVWQFLNSDRLVQRLQPWDRVGVEPQAVDPGDYLLDWRRGGEGLRYVHHFSDEELSSLADASGFTVRTSFLSDGQGGKLGLYQIWELQQ